MLARTRCPRCYVLWAVCMWLGSHYRISTEETWAGQLSEKDGNPNREHLHFWLKIYDSVEGFTGFDSNIQKSFLRIWHSTVTRFMVFFRKSRLQTSPEKIGHAVRVDLCAPSVEDRAALAMLEKLYFPVQTKLWFRSNCPAIRKTPMRTN